MRAHLARQRELAALPLAERVALLEAQQAKRRRAAATGHRFRVTPSAAVRGTAA
jgi:hypothetical protein